MTRCDEADAAKVIPKAPFYSDRKMLRHYPCLKPSYYPTCDQLDEFCSTFLKLSDLLVARSVSPPSGRVTPLIEGPPPTDGPPKEKG